MAAQKTYLMTKGYMAQLFQKSPAAIDGVLRVLDIEAEFSINGLDHYGTEAYNALAEHFEALAKLKTEAAGNG